jgi:hypothetical protein
MAELAARGTVRTVSFATRTLDTVTTDGSISSPFTSSVSTTALPSASPSVDPPGAWPSVWPGQLGWTFGLLCHPCRRSTRLRGALPLVDGVGSNPWDPPASRPNRPVGRSNHGARAVEAASTDRDLADWVCLRCSRNPSAPFLAARSEEQATI